MSFCIPWLFIFINFSKHIDLNYITFMLYSVVSVNHTDAALPHTNNSTLAQLSVYNFSVCARSLFELASSNYHVAPIESFHRRYIVFSVLNRLHIPWSIPYSMGCFDLDFSVIVLKVVESYPNLICNLLLISSRISRSLVNPIDCLNNDSILSNLSYQIS